MFCACLVPVMGIAWYMIQMWYLPSENTEFSRGRLEQMHEEFDFVIRAVETKYQEL